MDVLKNFLFPKAVNGLLSECIRRYFFPSRAKETKKQKKKKKKNNNNNNNNNNNA